MTEDNLTEEDLASFRAALRRDDVFHMSDADWKRIGDPWELPAEARRIIDALITWFRMFEDGLKGREPAAARRRLDRAVNATKALIETLRGLPPEAVDALICGPRQPDVPPSVLTNPLNAVDRFQGEIERLERLKD